MLDKEKLINFLYERIDSLHEILANEVVALESRNQFAYMKECGYIMEEIKRGKFDV